MPVAAVQHMQQCVSGWRGASGARLQQLGRIWADTACVTWGVCTGRARRPFCVGYVTQSGQQQQSVKRLEVDPSGCFAGVGPAGRIKHHLFWPRTFFGA